MKTDKTRTRRAEQDDFSSIPPPPELPWSDPWLHETPKVSSLPDDAKFLCVFGTCVNPFDLEEAAFLVRQPGRDELWVADDLGTDRRVFETAKRDGVWRPHYRLQVSYGRAVADLPKEEPWASALSLFHRLIRSRVGFGWPNRFHSGGLIDEATFTNLVWGIEAVLNPNVEAAKEAESVIVATARELGLDPEPTGRGEDEWRASCPSGHGHHLYIQAEAGLFLCGYCRRSGGWKELCEWVDDRGRPDDRAE